MELLQFMFVPLILFMTIVAPIWLVLHYRSVNRSSRGLSEDDRESIEQMLETVDKLTERIGVLEDILDGEHPDWRQQKSRRERVKEQA